MRLWSKHSLFVLLFFIGIVLIAECKQLHLPLYKMDKITKFLAENSETKPDYSEKLVHNPYFEPRPRLKEAIEKISGKSFSSPTPTDLNLTGKIWPTGGFWTYTNVGTPPQLQMTQIDTGSSDLLVPQLNCINCPNTVQYNPSASSTAKQIPCDTFGYACVKPCHDYCEFNNSYQTCDLQDPTATCYQGGPVYEDIFTVADLNVTVGFGSVAANLGANDTQSWYMPGVWGVAYPAIAGIWKETIINALVEAGEIEDILSICINNLKGSGVFTLGGYDESLFDGSLQYTPIIQHNWYTLNITDFGVGGVSLGLPWSVYFEGGSLFDSGTNTIIVPSQAYDIIAAMFVQECGSGSTMPGICGDVPTNETLFSGVCYEMDPSDFAQFPNFSISFNEIPTPFYLNATDYLIEEDGKYCMGIQNSGPGGFTILGNIFQLPYYLVLDRANSKMGIAPLSNGCNPSQEFPEPDLSVLLSKPL